MEVIEMHIEVNTSLQKINSNVFNQLLPEEIDWVLNKSQDRFLKNKVTTNTFNKGFEVDQKALDDIQALIVIEKQLDAAILPIKTIGNNTIDLKLVEASFPSNYYYLLSDKSAVLYDCKTLDTTTQTKTEYCSIIPFSYTNCAPLSLVIDSNTVFDFATLYPNYNSSTYTTDLSFYVVNHILENSTSNYGEVYWETYKNLFYPNSFIVVTPASATVNLTVGTTRTISQVIPITYSIFNPIAGKKLQVNSNNLTKIQYSSDFKSNNVFYKTIYKSPLSTINKNTLNTNYSESFIVAKTLIDYIKKPRLISSNINQSCELSPSTHQQICDLAVEYFQMTLKDPAWKDKLQDNINRATIN